VRDNLELKPSAYRITLRGVIVGEGLADTVRDVVGVWELVLEGVAEGVPVPDTLGVKVVEVV
jgi:flagellar biosynthesis component FlhA